MRSFDRSAMLDQRFDTTQARRTREILKLVCECKSFSTRACHTKREHGAEATFHLLACQRMSRMSGKAWIEHSLDVRLLAQEFGQLRRRVGLRAHATGQGREAAANQPAIERRGHAARRLLILTKAVQR